MGESKKLTVKQVRQEKKEKLKSYRKLAFEASDPAVAAVDEGGNITAVGDGRATICVYAQDGAYRVAVVTVASAPAAPNLGEAAAAEDGEIYTE